MQRSLLPKDLDLDKYVASGVAAYSMSTRQQLWSQHLDLSTALTTFQAFAYSAPTLVDLDRDGHLEVILGTSMVSLGQCRSARLHTLFSHSVASLLNPHHGLCRTNTPHL